MDNEKPRDPKLQQKDDLDLPPLSGRANRLASLLGTIASPTLPRTVRDAACEDLADETSWSEPTCSALAVHVRQTVGSGAARRDWLIAAGWLRQADRTTEQLPEPRPRRHVEPTRIGIILADAFRQTRDVPSVTAAEIAEEDEQWSRGDSTTMRAKPIVWRKHDLTKDRGW